MAVPSLLAAAEGMKPEAELLRLEEVVAGLSASAKASGYDLERLLAQSSSEKLTLRDKRAGGAAAEEELSAEGLTTAKKTTQSESEGGRRG
jgi:hypothetical protein